MFKLPDFFLCVYFPPLLIQCTKDFCWVYGLKTKMRIVSRVMTLWLRLQVWLDYYKGRLLAKSLNLFLACLFVVVSRISWLSPFQRRIPGSGKFDCPRVVLAWLRMSPLDLDRDDLNSSVLDGHSSASARGDFSSWMACKMSMSFS